MIFATCIVASAIGLMILPFSSSLHNMDLTKEQLDKMKGFKLNNFFESRVIPVSIIDMSIFICYSSVVSFLAVYSQEIHLVNAASFFFIVYAAVILVSRPIIGRLFDLKGENAIMYPAILIFTIEILLFSQTHHGYTFLLAGALIGLGFGAIQSSTQAISVKITPQHRMGLANSTYFAFSDIGMGLSPLVVGFLIHFTGYRGIYTVLAIFAAVCLLLYNLLYGKKAMHVKDKAGF